MSDNHQARSKTSLTGTQFVVITGRSVHGPNERAQPRPPDRPRIIPDGEAAPLQIFVDSDEPPAEDVAAEC